EIFAALRNHFKLGGGAKVHHDARAAVLFKGGNAIGDAVGAHLGGIVDKHLHAGLDAGLDEYGFDVKVGLADLSQGGVDGRHDGGDDDVRHLAGRHAVHLKEIHEKNTVLVDSLGAMRCDAPVGGKNGLFPVDLVKPKRRIRVADIESEQHDF